MPEEYARVARRSIWSGTLSFGLVSIPVSLLSAVSSRDVRLRMLDADGTPLSRRYFCPKSGRELQGDELIKGYETDASHYVTVEDEELAGLQPEKSGDIDLRRFVPRREIAPLYFNRPYVLFPAGKSVKAYRLLAQVLDDEQTAGIATFIMRGREYLVAILADEGLLWAETLRFADELRSPMLIGLPEKATDAQQLRTMKQAIGRLSEDSVPDEELRDRYAERLAALVAKKRRHHQEDVVEVEDEAEADEADEPIDLMALLKQRLAEEAA